MKGSLARQRNTIIHSLLEIVVLKIVVLKIVVTAVL